MRININVDAHVGSDKINVLNMPNPVNGCTMPTQGHGLNMPNKVPNLNIPNRAPVEWVGGGNNKIMRGAGLL